MPFFILKKKIGSFYLSLTFHLILVLVSGFSFFWIKNSIIEDKPPIQINFIKNIEKQEETKSLSKFKPEPVVLKEKPKKIIEKKQTNILKKVFEKSTPINEVVVNKQIETPQEISQNQINEIKKLSTTYEKSLFSILSRSKRYPDRARKRGQEGGGSFSLKLNSSGVVEEVKIINSTGSNILDGEIFDLVKRASPLPPLPQGMSQLEIIVPIKFDLSE